MSPARDVQGGSRLLQEPQAVKGPISARGRGAIGELSSWKALLWSRQEGGAPLRCSTVLSQDRLAPANFSFTYLFVDFKAERSCSSCPGAGCTKENTFREQYPLAAAAAVCTLVLQFHSLLISLFADA